MKYIQITNDPDIAKFISACGVDFIMIDLETLGKDIRQKDLDTVKSKHNLNDIQIIKDVIKNTNSKIITRINPFNDYTKFEIDKSIENGTDYIMLPMFTTKHEVKSVINYIKQRVKLILLFETPKSIIYIDQILELKNIDEAFIGLNDLSLSFKINFMFELLPSSLIEFVAKKFKEKKIPFGVGGISRIGKGTLDSRLILSEHVRLGSTRVIISRSFTERANTLNELNQKMDFKKEIKALTDEYKSISKLNLDHLQKNRKIILNKLSKIIK